MRACGGEASWGQAHGEGLTAPHLSALHGTDVSRPSSKRQTPQGDLDWGGVVGTGSKTTFLTLGVPNPSSLQE